MRNLIKTNYDGMVILKHPIHTDGMTIYGCLTNGETDLKDLHQFFCYTYARQLFLDAGGRIEGDEWSHPIRKITFTCEEGLVKFFEYLFGYDVKCDMIELPPYETISYYAGEIEMDNVIVNKAIIERYTNKISEDEREEYCY